jgi:hypothetical protein
VLNENTSEIGNGVTPTWAQDWREIDRALRGIAKRRAALDAEEARWLREAEHVKIWEPLGMVSAPARWVTRRVRRRIGFVSRVRSA